MILDRDMIWSQKFDSAARLECGIRQSREVSSIFFRSAVGFRRMYSVLVRDLESSIRVAKVNNTRLACAMAKSTLLRSWYTLVCVTLYYSMIPIINYCLGD